MPVWQTVTVALAPAAFWSSSIATGLPTMLLRPHTTHVLACRVMAGAHQHLLHPRGRTRHKNVGLPAARRPRLKGCRPSTSFLGSMV